MKRAKFDHDAVTIQAQFDVEIMPDAILSDVRCFVYVMPTREVLVAHRVCKVFIYSGVSRFSGLAFRLTIMVTLVPNVKATWIHDRHRRSIDV